MRVVDDGDVKREYIPDIGEKFNMKFHGKKTDSLDHLCKILHTIPKFITISHMSPTSRVFQYHMIRAHLQVKNFKNWKKKILVLREMSMKSRFR